MSFYSARLLFVILVDDGRPRKKNHYDDRVVVFRARNFEHAFERAVEIGNENGVAYKNSVGQRVRWAFVEVINLDLVGKSIDGKEVASKLHYRVSKKPIPFSRKFSPELSTLDGSF